jgi:hypothetical protein
LLRPTTWIYPPDDTAHRIPGTSQSGVTPVMDVTDVTTATCVTPVPAAPPETTMPQEHPHVARYATDHRVIVSPECVGLAAPPCVPPVEGMAPTRQETVRADPLWPHSTARDGPDTGEAYEEFPL